MSETDKGFFESLWNTFTAGLPPTPEQYHKSKFGENLPRYHTRKERNQILRQIEDTVYGYVLTGKMQDPDFPIEGIILIGSFAHNNSHEGNTTVEPSDLDYFTLVSSSATGEVEDLATSLSQATKRDTHDHEAVLISKLDEKLPSLYYDILYGVKVITPSRNLEKSVTQKIKNCVDKYSRI